MTQKWNNNAEPNPTIKHFSHPHVLNLINYQPNNNNNNNHHQTLILCSCCNLKLTPSSRAYSCTQCSYFLHVSCSRTPHRITHPSCPAAAAPDGRRHVFDLLTRPGPGPGPGGVFTCAACLEDDAGFSYHCRPCGADLHPGCAAAPLSLRHRAHPHHELRLAFSPPQTAYSCGACGRVGARGWLYRCQACKFDIHFRCARAQAGPEPVAPSPPPWPSRPGVNADQGYLNQRYAEYLIRNHPHMIGTALRAQQPNYNNNNNVFTNHVNQQQAIQQQAVMQILRASNNNANNYQNLVNQMLLTSGGGGGDPSAFDAGSVSGFGTDFGDSAGGLDFGSLSGGGFDFSGFTSF